MQTLHKANLQLAQSNIDACNEVFLLVQDRVNKLTVRAGIKGVLQQLPSPIAIFDNNTALVHANEAFSNWIGKPWQSQRLLKAHKFSLEYHSRHWRFNHPTLGDE
ncbi:MULTISPECIES: hypothetical protein [Pseudoalteromonas]|uniref:PAS domain-containing protein n=1 Tax=Pseudoalteromonas piscicida TaxID=43662 RepID=A0ABM6NA81_PSEO7|nr:MULTISPECIES: hypothetical protein [Pseudoalteromonas]ATD05653.1 hypothetical protein PPIS_a0333 [Pseudoalteromonas piscicida]MCO7201664.1 hypothetical protein [Pseudoalteromonas sp. OANN1]WPU32443.1 hypothetical protein SIO17_01485 [Pseudoalteromonas piscicida]